MSEYTTRIRLEGDSSSYQESSKKAVASNEKLLESGNKVKRNLSGLAHDMLNASSATELLANGMARLSEVFKTSLGWGIGIGIAVVALLKLTQKIKEAREEARKAEIDQRKQDTGNRRAVALHDIDAERKAISKLSEQLSEVTEKQRKMRERNPVLTFLHDMVNEDVSGTKMNVLERDRKDITREMERIGRDINQQAERHLDLTEAEIRGETTRAALLKLSAERELAMANLDKVDASYVEKEAADREFRRLKQRIEVEGRIKDMRADGAREAADIEDEAVSKAEKRYRLAWLAARLAGSEGSALTEGNIDTAKGGRAEAAALEARKFQRQAREQEEELNLGKTRREINARFKAQRKEEGDLTAHRKKLADAGGLLSPHRDISGNVVSGINPVTGKREEVAPPDALAADKFRPRLAEDRGKGEEAFREQFLTKAQRKAKEDAEAAVAKQRAADAAAKPPKLSTDATAITSKLDQVGDKITNKLDAIAIA